MVARKDVEVMTQLSGPEAAVADTLIQECRQWYAKRLRLRSSPVRGEDIVFLRGSSEQKALGWYTNRIDLRRVAVSLWVIGAGIITLMLITGETLGNAVRLTSGVMLAGAAYLPFVFRRARLFVNWPRHQCRVELARTLVHEFAHAYHNRWLRGWFHSALDLILWPFALSYEEGIATWVEAEYCRSNGVRFDVRTLPTKYRRSYEMIASVEHALGRRAVIWLLKFG